MTLTLCHLEPGQTAIIRRIRDDGRNGFRQRLLDMGITRGTRVRMERSAPLGDPVEVVIKGYYLALRRSEAG